MSRHAAPTSRGRRCAVVAGTVAIGLVLPTGVAHAYFRSTGSGTATAGAGQFPALTATSTPAAALIPGGTSNLVLTVSNPTGVAVQVTAVSNVSAITTDGGAGGTCTASNSKVVFAAPSSGLPFTVPAGGQINVTLGNAVSMGLTAASGCQGATFTVPVTLTGKTL